MWVCAEGDTVTLSNGILVVEDEKGNFIKAFKADEEKISRLDDGRCPICENWNVDMVKVELKKYVERLL